MRTSEFKGLMQWIVNLWDKNSLSFTMFWLACLSVIVGAIVILAGAKTHHYDHVNWTIIHIGEDIVYGAIALYVLGPINTGVVRLRDRKPDKLSKHQQIIKHNEQLERQLLELERSRH